MSRGSTVAFDQSLVVAATPEQVIRAFFDPEALASWWQTIRSVTTPQVLGIYAVEWAPSTYRDDVLGPLGGVFYGVVIEYTAGRDFFVADAYWVPPEGEPLGPMGLEITVAREGQETRLRVIQTGSHSGPRWSRYYTLIAPGWRSALHALRTYLGQGPEALEAARRAARHVADTASDGTPSTP